MGLAAALAAQVTTEPRTPPEGACWPDFTDVPGNAVFGSTPELAIRWPVLVGWPLVVDITTPRVMTADFDKIPSALFLALEPWAVMPDGHGITQAWDVRHWRSLPEQCYVTVFPQLVIPQTEPWGAAYSGGVYALARFYVPPDPALSGLVLWMQWVGAVDVDRYAFPRRAPRWEIATSQVLRVEVRQG